MNTRFWLAATVLAFSGSLVQADMNETNSGFYAGSGAGLYTVDFSDIDYNESATTVRVFGGYTMNDYVSFEAGYTSLFESSASVLGVDVAMDGSSWDATVLPTLPIGDNFRAFGIVGMTQYDFEIAVNILGESVSETDSDSSMIYGLGGAMDITDSWTLRGEWVTIDVDDADWGIVSVAATYKFR